MGRLFPLRGAYLQLAHSFPSESDSQRSVRGVQDKQRRGILPRIHSWDCPVTRYKHKRRKSWHIYNLSPIEERPRLVVTWRCRILITIKFWLKSPISFSNSCLVCWFQTPNPKQSEIGTISMSSHFSWIIKKSEHKTLTQAEVSHTMRVEQCSQNKDIFQVEQIVKFLLGQVVRCALYVAILFKFLPLKFFKFNNLFYN